MANRDYGLPDQSGLHDTRPFQVRSLLSIELVRGLTTNIFISSLLISARFIVVKAEDIRYAWSRSEHIDATGVYDVSWSATRRDQQPQCYNRGWTNSAASRRLLVRANLVLVPESATGRESWRGNPANFHAFPMLLLVDPPDIVLGYQNFEDSLIKTGKVVPIVLLQNRAIDSLATTTSNTCQNRVAKKTNI